MSLKEAKNVQYVQEDEPTVPVSRNTFIYGFIVLFILFMLDFAARLGVTTVFPMMQKDLGLSDSKLGLAGSVVLLGMSMLVLPFSFLADRGRKNRAIAYMGALWGAGALMCGFATNFIWILLGRFTIGMGNASYAPVSVSMLTSWIKKSRWGTTIGFYNSSMALGMSVGTAASGFLAHAYGWRVPFIVIGTVTVLFSVMALRLPSMQSSTQKEKVSIKEATSVTLKNKTIIGLGIGIGIINLINIACVAWVPVYLVRVMQWNVAEVGGVLGVVYMIKGIGLAPLSGLIADRLSRWDVRTRAWFAVPCSLMLGASFTVGFVYQFFPCIALGLCMISLPVAGVHTATQDIVPARYKACAYGTYVLFLQALGFVGPTLTGFLSDTFGVEQSLIYIQGLSILSALSLLIAGFTYRGDNAKARAMEAQDRQRAADGEAADGERAASETANSPRHAPQGQPAS